MKPSSHHWPCCCSDRRLGRSEGSEQRRVLQLGEARVGRVEEDEACTGEEVRSSSLSLIIIIIIDYQHYYCCISHPHDRHNQVGRRHPDLPQTLLLLRPEEKLRAISLNTSPPHLPMSPPSTKPTKHPPKILPTTQTPKIIVIQKLWGVRRRLFIICWKRGWSRLIFCEKCGHFWWYFSWRSIASNLYSV